MDHENNPQPKAITPFEALGGEATVMRLTERFYELMDTQTEFAALRAVHPPDLAHAKERLTWFLIGWLGGPPVYMERVGHPMLRARHLPFSIGILERDQWLACMSQAMKDCHIPAELREPLEMSFFGTADWMRNKAGG
jgi:hemoglobin